MSAFLLINYTRPDKTAETLDNLRWVKDLLLFCDGPKAGKDSKKNTETRNLLSDFAALRKAGGYKTQTLFAEQNLGPKLGPLTAIQWLFRERETGHIVEDDILLAPGFEAAHEQGLSLIAGRPDIFAVAEGHPLPDCPTKWLETRMARLVAWSSTREKIGPLLEKASQEKPLWSGKTTAQRARLLNGLHPKTKVFLWKEFWRLDVRPQWSWHYHLMQHQLEAGLLGLTPTARLHENTGVDGSGANCINLFGETEGFTQKELYQWGEKPDAGGKDAQSERKMETERYGRIHQALGRILYKMTPVPWKNIWKPAKTRCQKRGGTP